MRTSRLARWAFFTALAVASPALADDPAPLARAGFLGAKVGPITPSDRQALKVEYEGPGLLLHEAVPGSAIEAAGFLAGDVLVEVNGSPIPDAAAFVALVSGHREGEKLQITRVRGADRQTVDVSLLSRPRETGANYDVEYGSVTSRGARLRTITTKPKGDGPFPALFIIQGVSCTPVEISSAGYQGYQHLIDPFTADGYLTFRVEKPGCGDSEGGPCSSVDFPTELDGYRQALAALKARKDVDPDRILIFGHSMGGVMGPILAAETPVRGLAVYGTVIKNWFEYMLENTRRQLVLSDVPDADLDSFMRFEIRSQYALLVEGKSLSDLAADPEMAAHLRQISPDLTLLSGRNPEFFHQLQQINLPEAWAKLDCQVLAMHGSSDFVSTADDHFRIAETVNDSHPDHARYLEIPSAAHGFETATTAFDAFSNVFTSDFTPSVSDSLLSWARDINPAAPAESSRDRRG